MTGPANPASQRRSAWEPAALIAPAAAASVMGLVLATGGYSLVGFAIATSCADAHEAVHGCDAMYGWMNAGRIGQWLLVLVTIILFVTGFARPVNRKTIAITTWAISPLALAWFIFYMYSANHSF